MCTHNRKINRAFKNSNKSIHADLDKGMRKGRRNEEEMMTGKRNGGKGMFCNHKFGAEYLVGFCFVCLCV